MDFRITLVRMEAKVGKRRVKATPATYKSRRRYNLHSEPHSQDIISIIPSGAMRIQANCLTCSLFVETRKPVHEAPSPEMASEM